MDREQQATREELEHAQTALAQQQNAVADAQAQVHLANQRVQVAPPPPSPHTISEPLPSIPPSSQSPYSL